MSLKAYMRAIEDVRATQQIILDKLDQIERKIEEIQVSPPVFPEDVKEIFKKILAALLPNEYFMVTVDTSNTQWKSLGIKGTGFWIVDVGGGFSYKMNKLDRPEITAEAGGRWDFEFENIYVKGSGTSGTGKIIYWQRIEK